MIEQPITNSKSGNPISRDEALVLIKKMAEEFAGAVGHGGARVNVGIQDQRFTKLMNWVWATIGGFFVVGVMYLGTAVTGAKESIVELNGKISVLVAQREQDNQDRHDIREEMKDLRHRIDAFEHRP